MMMMRGRGLKLRFGRFGSPVSESVSWYDALVWYSFVYSD